MSPLADRGRCKALIGLDEVLNLFGFCRNRPMAETWSNSGSCSQLLHLDVQLRFRCGQGLVSLERWPCGDASLPLLFQSLCHQQAGGTLQPSVADQQQGHRSRSSLESQPNPTTPSRMLRTMRRVR